jgi:ABC-type glycerol-3-phosphate transport system substrate-binding protein
MEPVNTAKFAMATGGYLPVRLSAYQTDEYKTYLTNPPIDKINHSKAANVALSYLDSGYKFFVDPAFVGSAQVREEVGKTFSAIIVNKKDITKRIADAYNTLGPSYER